MQLLNIHRLFGARIMTAVRARTESVVQVGSAVNAVSALYTLRRAGNHALRKLIIRVHVGLEQPLLGAAVHFAVRLQFAPQLRFLRDVLHNIGLRALDVSYTGYTCTTNEHPVGALQRARHKIGIRLLQELWQLRQCPRCAPLWLHFRKGFAKRAIHVRKRLDVLSGGTAGSFDSVAFLRESVKFTLVHWQFLLSDHNRFVLACALTGRLSVRVVFVCRRNVGLVLVTGDVNILLGVPQAGMIARYMIVRGVQFALAASLNLCQQLSPQRRWSS